MNQTQREYLRERIRNITNSKVSKLEAKYTTKGIAVTNKAKWGLILDRTVKPKKSAKINTYHTSYYLEDLYDFSEYEDKVDNKKLKPALAKLRAKSQDVRDRAMLGDCDQAIKLLAELEEF